MLRWIAARYSASGVSGVSVAIGGNRWQSVAIGGNRWYQYYGSAIRNMLHAHDICHRRCYGYSLTTRTKTRHVNHELITVATAVSVRLNA